jgi:hypothetical protein
MKKLLTITCVLFFLMGCKGQNFPPVYEVESDIVRLVKSDSLFTLTEDSLWAYDGHVLWNYTRIDTSAMLTMEIAYFDDNGETILSKDRNGHYTFYVPIDSVINYMIKREDNAWEQYNELYLKCTGRKP